MAVWWTTEAIPLAATSLLPIVLMPMVTDLDVAGSTAPYASPIVFLFLGGFLIAIAMAIFIRVSIFIFIFSF